MERKNLVNVFIILIVSLISVADLFFHPGRPITFDGHIHMTTMAQFAVALKDSEFPVTWSNGFANYGLPLPLFAHQIPAYLGAVFILIGSSVVGAYNLSMAIGVIFAAFFFYKFLSNHVSLHVALSATIVFALFPYRIINIYIRGALPEILASAFFPLALIGIDLIFLRKNRVGYILFCFSIFFLAVSHPMMLVIFGLPLFAYLLFSIRSKKNWRPFVGLGAAGVLGLAMASYYLFPLVLEMRYFYQGTQTSSTFHFDDFLNLKSFIDPNWYYYLTHPGPRGNFIKLGIPEGLIVLGAVIATFLMFKNKQQKKNTELIFWTGLTVVFVFLLLPVSQFVYKLVPGMDMLQYPWRFLNALQFTIPILLALLIERMGVLKKPVYLQVLFVLLVSFVAVRMPQLYGKNFAVYSDAHFYFTPTNLHTQNLNTVWSENSENYPRKTVQAAVLEGTGTIEPLQLKNASRLYKVSAQTELRLIDYTFYFPGWQVTVDNQTTPIEFQDINYRGLITYKVPAGEHTVGLVYGMSKTRKLAFAISALALLTTVVLSGIILVNPRNWFKIQLS